jgi:hypothetical protein
MTAQVMLTYTRDTTKSEPHKYNHLIDDDDQSNA